MFGPGKGVVNMKCLVLSDSHGVGKYMAEAVRRETPGQILHLGDVVGDVSPLARAFPEIPIAQVLGNCDLGRGADLPEERELLLEGKRIWMLHGHTYWVKSGPGLVVNEALTRGTDVVCFGHTHQPLCYREGSLWVLNPGACGGSLSVTYGVIEIGADGVTCRVEKLR